MVEQEICLPTSAINYTGHEINTGEERSVLTVVKAGIFLLVSFKRLDQN